MGPGGVPCKHACQQFRAARHALPCDDGLAYDSCIVHSTSKKRFAAANRTLLLPLPFAGHAHRATRRTIQLLVMEARCGPICTAGVAVLLHTYTLPTPCDVHDMVRILDATYQPPNRSRSSPQHASRVPYFSTNLCKEGRVCATTLVRHQSSHLGAEPPPPGLKLSWKHVNQFLMLNMTRLFNALQPLPRPAALAPILLNASSTASHTFPALKPAERPPPSRSP